MLQANFFLCHNFFPSIVSQGHGPNPKLVIEWTWWYTMVIIKAGNCPTMITISLTKSKHA